MKMFYGGVICNVSADKGVRIYGSRDPEYCDEAICYAVMRYFSKNIELCRKCVWESYSKRVLSGKGRKPSRCKAEFSASDAELPGKRLEISYTIDFYGVSINKINFIG